MTPLTQPCRYCDNNPQEFAGTGIHCPTCRVAVSTPEGGNLTDLVLRWNSVYGAPLAVAPGCEWKLLGHRRYAETFALELAEMRRVGARWVIATAANAPEGRRPTGEVVLEPEMMAQLAKAIAPSVRSEPPAIAPIPRIGVAAVVIRDGKILVGERGPKSKRGRGQYSVPGGALDFGEPLHTAVMREFREETGVEFIIASAHMGITQSRFEGEHWITVAFMGTIFGDAPPVVTEPDKCVAWEFVAIDDLRAMPSAKIFPPFRGILEAVRAS